MQEKDENRGVAHRVDCRRYGLDKCRQREEALSPAQRGTMAPPSIDQKVAQ
jgi:hypothetical protein